MFRTEYPQYSLIVPIQFGKNYQMGWLSESCAIQHFKVLTNSNEEVETTLIKFADVANTLEERQVQRNLDSLNSGVKWIGWNSTERNLKNLHLDKKIERHKYRK